jgi:hypothetical protein
VITKCDFLLLPRQPRLPLSYPLPPLQVPRESPDPRPVKQRVRQPKPTILLLPLLTSRPPQPPLPQPHASEKGSLPRRVPTPHCHPDLQVDGPRDKRSPKLSLPPPPITITNHHLEPGERENLPQRWIAQKITGPDLRIPPNPLSLPVLPAENLAALRSPLDLYKSQHKARPLPHEDRNETLIAQSIKIHQ